MGRKRVSTRPLNGVCWWRQVAAAAGPAIAAAAVCVRIHSTDREVMLLPRLLIGRFGAVSRWLVFAITSQLFYIFAGWRSIQQLWCRENCDDDASGSRRCRTHAMMVFWTTYAFSHCRARGRWAMVQNGHFVTRACCTQVVSRSPNGCLLIYLWLDHRLDSLCFFAVAT